MPDLEIFDVDALLRPVGRAKVFGNLYDVLPANGRAIDLLHQIAGRDPADRGALSVLEVGRSIVADSIPALPEDQRNRLTMEQVEAIIGVATRQVDQVRTLIAGAEGNGESPTETPPVVASGKSGRKSSTR